MKKYNNSALRITTLLTMGMLSCANVSSEEPNENSCSTDMDCPLDQICEAKVCTSFSESEEEISIKLGQTNANGDVFFTDDQTGREVGININNIVSGEPIPEVLVSFFDGDGFEAFQLEHLEYVPQLEIASHNSSHNYSLTPAPLQVLNKITYENSGRERSEPAAEQFHQWLIEQGSYQGCYTQDHLETMALGGSLFVKSLFKIFSIGIVADYIIDHGVQYLIQEALGEWNENQVADIYVLTPRNYGSPGTVAIWAIDVRNRETNEVCQRGSTSNPTEENPPVENPSVEEPESCDLPSCLQFGVNYCNPSCVYVTEHQCTLPCERDQDCQTGSQFVLRCLSLEPFGLSGKGCFLPPCTLGCSSQEDCIDITEHSFQGDIPATFYDYDICFPRSCLTD